MIYHNLDTEMPSPLYVLPCVLLQCLSQTWHWQGFSHVCLTMCCFKLHDCVSDLSQTWHWNAVSSVWIAMCCFKLLDCVNDLFLEWHWHDPFPVCVNMCSFKWHDRSYDLSQTWHWNGLTAVSSCMRYHVMLQVTWFCKWFITKLTLEWPLPCMR